MRLNIHCELKTRYSTGVPELPEIILRALILLRLWRCINHVLTYLKYLRKW